MNYILKDKQPVFEPDIVKWGMWISDHENKRVAFDTIEGVEVSTVFLGTDHNFFGKPPILFETMIFGGEHNEYQEIYKTWVGAEAGHARAIKMVKAALHAG